MAGRRSRRIALLLVGVGLAGILAFGGHRWLAARRTAGGGQPDATGEPSAMLRELEAGQESVTTEVNAKAPALASVSLDGESVRSIDFIGNKVILLEFWSVFCTSCLEEMPFLAELREKYRGQGLEVIGINTDYFPTERVRRFFNKLEPRPGYPVVHDQSQEISKAFHVEALPVTVLIDSAGWIRMYHLGYKPEDRAIIEGMVKKWTGRIKETVETVGAVDGRTRIDARTGAPGEGIPLPEVKVRDAAGKPISLGGYRRDGPLVLFFWSLFCQPCRQEMPRLAELAGKLESAGVRFLSVNLDSARLEEQVGKFLGRERLPFPTLLDARSEPAGALAAQLGVAYTPTIVLVDRQGIVRRVLVGEASAESLEKSIREVAAPVGGPRG